MTNIIRNDVWENLSFWFFETFISVSEYCLAINRNINTCKDINCGSVQQCHEPMGNSPGTKSTQGHSTRPLCKVTFSQSGPTTIRPDLNNFLAWLLRLPRAWPIYNGTCCAFWQPTGFRPQAFAHRPLPTGQKPEPFHLTFWLVWNPSTKASPRSSKSH